MKKILLVTRPICPPWDEASKNFAYTLAKNVKDVEFGVLTHGQVDDLPLNVHQHQIYTSGSFGYLQKMRLINNLRKIKKQYDILHYLFTPTKSNSFLIKHFLSCKKSAHAIQTIATLREDLYSDNEIKKILFGDLIVTYSNYSKNKLNSLGFNNVRRIYPGIDLNLYSPAPKDDDLMKKLGIMPDDFVVTYPGEFTRLGKIDNIINMLIDNSGILHEKKIKFIFACRVKTKEDAHKKEEIKNILEKNNLSSQVLLPDTFTTMEKVYNLSDVVIFPAQDMKGKFDIPMVVIEAMACEKPIVVSDIPILKEFLNSQNSVIMEIGNMEKLFSEIFEFYNNPYKKTVIGNNAKISAQENFDIKKIAEKYREIYEKL